MSSAAPSSSADHVVGTFPREGLSGALASTHRAGFGPQTRVLDGARGDAARQLQRMGLQIVSGDPPAADAVLIVVTAPGRTSIVSELFSRLGAEQIALACRHGADRPMPVKPSLLGPDIRIADDAATATDR